MKNVTNIFQVIKTYKDISRMFMKFPEKLLPDSDVELLDLETCLISIELKLQIHGCSLSVS